MKREDFVKELAQLINKNSLENVSNTPDFIIAEYLTKCLESFNQVVKMRDAWYKKDE